MMMMPYCTGLYELLTSFNSQVLALRMIEMAVGIMIIIMISHYNEKILYVSLCVEAKKYRMKVSKK